MDELNVGVVGLGRLGKKYAEVLQWSIKNINLIAVCSINAEELSYARNTLKVPYVYNNLDDFLAHKKMDAVFIVSSTNLHAEHIITSLEAGFHVFCEKPLAITLDECLRVEKVANQYPDQIATVGFVRRHDPGYAYAMKKVKQGLIGKPFLVKSQTVDLDSTAGFQMEFVKTSGGMFHDFNVHDIDLARWFLEDEVKTVYSVGGAFKHPGFAEVNDADNVISTCVFQNGSMASIQASRTAANGHDTYTEVVGTDGLLRIGRPNVVTNVEIHDKYGARKECVKTFYERFEEAFHNQIKDFANCVMHGTKPSTCLRDATQATRAAIAMTSSLFGGNGLVVLDDLEECNLK